LQVLVHPGLQFFYFPSGVIFHRRSAKHWRFSPSWWLS